MALKIGNNAVANAFVGSSQVRRAYKGGTLVYQGFSPASEQEFIQQTATGGPAKLLKVYGKSVVNNQLVQNGDFNDGTNYWVGGSSIRNFAVEDNVASFYGTAPSSNFNVRIQQPFSATEGHHFAIIFSIKLDNSEITTFGVTTAFYAGSIFKGNFSFSGLATNIWNNLCCIIEARDGVNTLGFGISYAVASAAYNKKVSIKKCRAIDLTLRFGAGNEPTSVDEALRLLGGDAFDPAYDPGSLQSNKTAELRAERIPVINVWDEEWEVGAIGSNGQNQNDYTDRIRAKNYCPILPSTTYYFKTKPGISQGDVFFYDQNKTFISGSWSKGNKTFTTPDNCYFFRIAPTVTYGTTYNHDICINLSDPAINGNYYPHWRGKLTLNIPTLTSGGVAVFPDGLRGVGTDRDAAYGSTGEVARAVVDLGTLNWTLHNSDNVFRTSLPQGMKAGQAANVSSVLCPKYITTYVNNVLYGDKLDKSISVSSFIYIKDSAYTDAAAFKAAMSGVMLDYPLATPLTYTLDTPLPTDLTCVQGDILQRVSDNNCPFVGEMKFGL